MENVMDGDDHHPDLTAFTKEGHALLGEIVRGGMRVVYKTREESLDRIVAVKVLALALAGDTDSSDGQSKVDASTSCSGFVITNIP